MPQIPFRYLTAAEMTSLSKTLCEDEKAKVLAIPTAAPFLAIFEAAHARLLKAKPVVTTLGDDPRLGEISRAEKRLDVRNDHYLTALHLLTLANIELELAQPTPSEDAVSALHSLDRTLLPNGLRAGVTASYAADAGNAETLEKDVAAPGPAKLLGDLCFRQGVTAAAVVKDHIANAREIGKLEELRRIPAEQQDFAEARNQWIAAAKLMDAGLGAANTKEAEALRRPLVDKALEARATALAAMRKRAAEAKDGVTPAPAPAPAPVDGEKK